MATKILKINKFDGGMVDDVRTGLPNQASLIKNFDLGVNSSTLRPKVSLNKNTGSYSTNYGIQKLVYSGFNDSIYGLGVNHPTNTSGLIYKLSTLLDATNSTWVSTSQALSTTTNYKLWSIYKDYIYYGLDNNKVGRFGPMSGSPTTNNTWKTWSTAQNITADGFIGKDDSMYVATKSANRVRNWFASATSSDGTKLIGAVYGGYIYTSTDSGVNWTERIYSGDWKSICCSGDGTKAIAASLTGGIYYSSDSGATWTASNATADGYWSVACSDDGVTAYAVGFNNGDLFKSTNGGATWSQQFNGSYLSVACSTDGAIVYLQSPTGVTKSTDAGINWGVEVALTLTANGSIACSLDGSVVLTTAEGSYLYVSTNSGVSFTQKDSQRVWSRVSVSGTDGSKQYACVSSTTTTGYVYVSGDTGATWTAKNTDTNRSWQSVSTNADGTKAIAVAFGGFLYVSADSGATWSAVTTNALNANINRLSETTINEGVLVLPANLTVVQMCEYGNYMAIICKPDYEDSNSKLYIWDYISDDVSESIDLGEGQALAGENLEGSILIFAKHTGDNGTIPREDYIRVLLYSGGTPINLFVIKGKLYSTSSLIGLGTPAYNYGGQIYVGGYASSQESQYEPVIIRVGRKDKNTPLSWSIENYFTAGTNTGVYDFIFYKGNQIVATQGLTSLKEMYITYDANTFTTSSQYETLLIDGGDSTLYKQLEGVSVQYAPLPTAGQVVLKYRVDGATSWTTIFTDTTDGAISHESVNIESTGANFSQFREIEFRVESTGGAEITGLKVKYTELNGLLE
jgi:hypothetical protein